MNKVIIVKSIYHDEVLSIIKELKIPYEIKIENDNSILIVEETDDLDDLFDAVPVYWHGSLVEYENPND